MAFYAPDPIQSTQLIPGSNTPATGALLFCYQVGTTTKQNTYTDQSASTARTNPIVLDSGGNIPGNGEVWIASSAKFVLAPSNDTDPPSAPYWTRDGLPGMNNVAALIASSATGEWVQGSTATFVGVTAFSVVGDQTTLYTLGRRIKAVVTGGDRFGIVSSSVLSGGSTSVGVILDSSTLNGGLSAVSYGLLSSANGSVPWEVINSSGITVIGIVNVSNVAIFSSTVTGGFFIPITTGTTGFGLSTTGPAIYINSTKIFDVTSTQANVRGDLRISSTVRSIIPSFSVTSFTAVTSLTYLPASTATRIEVRAVAGGGGGAGAGGAGSNGSTTSFGGTSASGGIGGLTTGAGSAGVGGIGGSGAATYRVQGNPGQSVAVAATAQAGCGGGSVFFGGGGIGSRGNENGADGAANSGGGGGGGNSVASTAPRCGGGGGECFELYINIPATSYTYTVGAGGAGGAAGGGNAGGAGGSGFIIIKEYYV